jgi:alanine-synthesizing transaminase
MKNVRLSRRLAFQSADHEAENSMAQRIAAGFTVTDLTISNPARVGLQWGAEALQPLLAEAALHYEPDPRGPLIAREAVCRYYADHGANVAPDQLLLTASTSEAYSLCFRVLANPGEEILVPSPSYPLFEMLAGLDGLQVRSYPSIYAAGWWIDFAVLEASITPATRAIVVVHPNNPTGAILSEADALQLFRLCEQHDLFLIVDEVFLDYVYTNRASTLLCHQHARTIVLSGLSKICALPQMKVGWLVAPALPQLQQALTLAADAYLSLSAPAGMATPWWLEHRSPVQAMMRQRVRQSISILRELYPQAGLVQFLAPEAGWSACLRLPAHTEEVALVRVLRQEHGVVVHPGYYYDLTAGSWLVLSLLTNEPELRVGCAAIQYEVAERTR